MIEADEFGDWQPVLTHGMGLDECRARLIAAHEPLLKDRLDRLDKQELTPRDLRAVELWMRNDIAKHVDRMLPGVLLNMERSALIGDDKTRMH